jgi:hypothetical protein
MVRKTIAAAAGARSGLLDAVGLGLLASAAFTWSLGAGLAASGVGALLLNWRLNEGAE